jgi:hypothetical protein
MKYLKLYILDKKNKLEYVKGLKLFKPYISCRPTMIQPLNLLKRLIVKFVISYYNIAKQNTRFQSQDPLKATLYNFRYIAIISTVTLISQ